MEGESKKTSSQSGSAGDVKRDPLLTWALARTTGVWRRSSSQLGPLWPRAVPTLRDPNERVQGLPGTRSSCRAFSPAGAPAPVRLPGRKRAQYPPAERGLRTTVGTWARPQRCTRRHPPGSAQQRGSRRGPCRWGEGSSPFHFAPVRGNLRSVTRILERATCSAGRAAPGGFAGLGRRGLGTPGSGGHAGVGVPWRPAAAAR